MSIKANFSPDAGLLSEFGDHLDNTIVTSRDAAGQILVNGGAVSVEGGQPTVANTTEIQVSGQAGDAVATAGPLVCACFGVGVNTIRDAIASRAATSVEEIGKALRAGTNCGSCIPEMKKLLAQARTDGRKHDLAHTA